MSETLGYIHSVETFGLVDGPGVRYIIFCRGAPCAANTAITRDVGLYQGHRQDPAGGLLGRLPLPQLLAQQRRHDHQWRRAPAQLDFVSEVFRLAHAKKVQTALDTSAQPFAPDDAEWMARFDKLLANTDLVILDLKEIDDEKHKKLTGHTNKKYSGAMQYVASKGVDLWIRHVLVPGLTDDADGAPRWRAAKPKSTDNTFVYYRAFWQRRCRAAAAEAVLKP